VQFVKLNRETPSNASVDRGCGQNFIAGTDFRNNKCLERMEETVKGETAKLS
jgi:hypothetical protein